MIIVRFLLILCIIGALYLIAWAVQNHNPLIFIWNIINVFYGSVILFKTKNQDY